MRRCGVCGRTTLTSASSRAELGWTMVFRREGTLTVAWLLLYSLCDCRDSEGGGFFILCDVCEDVPFSIGILDILPEAFE
jgi:hypothetical protein